MDLGGHLRSYPLGNYILFYRYDAKKLELVRVIHRARDLESALTDDDR